MDEKYLVEDGCRSDAHDDFESSYELKSYKAGVRCCTEHDQTCETIGLCPDDATTFDDAVAKCSRIGKMLCTKEQLDSSRCCEKGGLCDHNPVWTKTIRYMSKS